MASSSSLLSVKRFFWIFVVCMVVLAVMETFLLLWLGTTVMFSVIDSLVSNATLAMACIAVSNGLRFYLPGANRFFYVIIWCCGLALVWLLLTRYALVVAMRLVNQDFLDMLTKSLPVRFCIAFLVLGLMAVINVLWYKLEQQKEDALRKSDTEKLAREAELNMLRQQLQPHFLFNSLNSINALITSRPNEAKRMVQQLSEFLRGTIKSEDQWVNLEDELHHLGLYLEIEKVRFGQRLITDVLCDEDCKKMKLPALLLQPLAENAIKFGLYDTTDEVTIRIHAMNENNQLKIEVQNPFDPETSSPLKGTGFGLASVQRRLYLLFGRNDLLQTSVNQNLFISTVKIPQP